MTPEQVERINEKTRTELEAPTSVEALTWLRDRDEDVTCVFSSNSEDMLADEEAIKLIEMLHAFGAEAVTAIEVEGYVEDEGIQDTDKLIITLPQDQNSRNKLFTFVNEWSHKRGWDPEPDIGQKYLSMWWG